MSTETENHAFVTKVVINSNNSQDAFLHKNSLAKFKSIAYAPRVWSAHRYKRSGHANKQRGLKKVGEKKGEGVEKNVKGVEKMWKEDPTQNTQGESWGGGLSERAPTQCMQR